MSDAFADLMQALPPERLVPGDPDGVDQMAQTMLRFSEVFADAAHALGLVDVLWLGRAAQAFQDEFELQPAAFKNAALAFHDAGFAMGSHAISMYSARQSVGAALQVFQRGVRAAHDAQSVAAVVGGLPTSGPLNLRTEPAGLQDRFTGIEKLDAAREQLEGAGSLAARKLRHAMAAAPRQVTAGEHLANFVRPELPWTVSDEKVDLAVGGARGLVDMAVLAGSVAMPTPENVLGMSRLDTQLDDVERKLGADPTSGWHTGGYVLIPAIATFGIEGLAVRSASTAVTDVTDVGGSSVRIPVRDLRTDVPLKAVNDTTA